MLACRYFVSSLSLLHTVFAEVACARAEEERQKALIGDSSGDSSLDRMSWSFDSLQRWERKLKIQHWEYKAEYDRVVLLYEEKVKITKPSKKDLRNKNVRNCRACEIEFESRTEFIEHCKFVHEIKFKPKPRWTVGQNNDMNFEKGSSPLKLKLLKCPSNGNTEFLGDSSKVNWTKIEDK